MRSEFTNIVRGGVYSAPTVEVLEIAVEKGFASTGVPPTGGVSPLSSYDDFYLSNEE